MDQHLPPRLNEKGFISHFDPSIIFDDLAPSAPDQGASAAVNINDRTPVIHPGMFDEASLANTTFSTAFNPRKNPPPSSSSPKSPNTTNVAKRPRKSATSTSTSSIIAQNMYAASQIPINNTSSTTTAAPSTTTPQADTMFQAAPNNDFSALQQQLLNNAALQNQILAAQAALVTQNPFLYPPSALLQQQFGGGFSNPFCAPFTSIYASQRTSASLHAAAQAVQQGMSLGQTSANTSGNFNQVMMAQGSTSAGGFNLNNLNMPTGVAAGPSNNFFTPGPADGQTLQDNAPQQVVPSMHKMNDLAAAADATNDESSVSSAGVVASTEIAARKKAPSARKKSRSDIPTDVSDGGKDFDGKWGERLEQLRQYKAEYGDCLVPDGYPRNQKLARWVREQRGQYKNLKEGRGSHMTQKRMDALNELGFTWSLREKVDWKDRYEELVAYKATRGDCLVPTNYAPNAQLGTWVANQRKHYRLFKEGKRSIMTLDRIDKLEKIGFQWTIRTSGRGKGDTSAANTKVSDSHIGALFL